MKSKVRIVFCIKGATNAWFRRPLLSFVGLLMFSGIANAYCQADQYLEAASGPATIQAHILHDGSSESDDCYTSPDLAAQQHPGLDASWDYVPPTQVGVYALVYANLQGETIRLHVLDHAIHPPEPRFLQVVRLLI